MGKGARLRLARRSVPSTSPVPNTSRRPSDLACEEVVVDLIINLNAALAKCYEAIHGESGPAIPVHPLVAARSLVETLDEHATVAVRVLASAKLDQGLCERHDACLLLVLRTLKDLQSWRRIHTEISPLDEPITGGRMASADWGQHHLLQSLGAGATALLEALHVALHVHATSEQRRGVVKSFCGR